MPAQAERVPRAKQGFPYSPPFLPCLLFARDLSDFVVKASPAAGVFSVGVWKYTANLVKILHMTRYFLRVRAACAFFGAEAGWGENQSANGCLTAASGHDYARCFGVWKTPPRASAPLSASRSYPVPPPARLPHTAACLSHAAHFLPFGNKKAALRPRAARFLPFGNEAARFSPLSARYLPSRNLRPLAHPTRHS